MCIWRQHGFGDGCVERRRSRDFIRKMSLGVWYEQAKRNYTRIGTMKWTKLRTEAWREREEVPLEHMCKSTCEVICGQVHLLISPPLFSVLCFSFLPPNTHTTTSPQTTIIILIVTLTRTTPILARGRGADVGACAVGMVESQRFVHVGHPMETEAWLREFG